ncbi:hypothetical protein E5Q_06083 [Mixia osmundae IAM 14324]|uniref:pH-response regulator protein palC n=1 Tax=Mixia osmundae (strain CBS 9802 / IAM 14324 / JCM 22182 / KY 12970) TaxID=764103 RepID=G7E9R8_MIXOS|nr:hypothetical protein E5Q_06083 [Mixia osmundae IAM 14324]
MSYLFDLPTTSAVSFADVLIDASGSSARAPQLAACTAARGRVRSQLKLAKRAAKRSAKGDKTGSSLHGPDWEAIIKVTQEYIPLVVSLQDCIDRDSLLCKTEPVFAWRPVLSSRLTRRPARLVLPSLRYELAAVLLTHALALANAASARVLSLGPYEHDKMLAESQRKANDEAINSDANMLTRASAIMTYLSAELLPVCETKAPSVKELPADLTKELTFALSKVLMADAERLAIRRLLSRSSADTALRPGPPLPRTHPSPGLLAKLYLNVYEHYDAARSTAKLVGGQRKTEDAHLSNDAKSIVLQSFRTYLSDGRAASLAIGYKWLGVEAGERMSKYGEAIGWLKLAREALQDLVSSGKPLASLLGRNKARAGRKSHLEAELASVEMFLTSYTQLNETITFEPVTTAATLLTRVPAGRSAMTVPKYELPKPIFSTTKSSIDMSSMQLALEGLDGGGDGAGSEDSDDDSDEQTGPSIGRYAGAGSYF